MLQKLLRNCRKTSTEQSRIGTTRATHRRASRNHRDGVGSRPRHGLLRAGRRVAATPIWVETSRRAGRADGKGCQSHSDSHAGCADRARR